MKIKIQKNLDTKPYLIEIPYPGQTQEMGEGCKVQVQYKIENHGSIKEENVILLADGRSYLVGNTVIRIENNFLQKGKNNYRFGIKRDGLVTQNHFIASIVRPVEPKALASNIGNGEVKSPMTGKIISLNFKENEQVREGDTLLVIEAMKMENRIVAEYTGTIKEIRAKIGANISAGELLLSLVPV